MELSDIIFSAIADLDKFEREFLAEGAAIAESQGRCSSGCTAERRVSGCPVHDRVERREEGK